MKRPRTAVLLFAIVVACVFLAGARANHGGSVPPDIQAVFEKPLYRGAIWGLRVVDLDTGAVLIDREPGCQFAIGSVRKVFSVGELLNQVGPGHRYNTPVYRDGAVDRAGVLHGNLILVASGDLTMGGRTNPDGSVAVSNYDHNEADTLGNAVLTAPDPLAGYQALAQQVRTAGIRQVDGEVIIDDRLFQPFNFRGQFDVRPIFVNDDVVDLTINPAAAGQLASVTWRPNCSALIIANKLTTAGADYTLRVDPQFPKCIGTPGCTAGIGGHLPLNFVPPLTKRFPLVQVVRIVEPSNYARTVFINALQGAGVSVQAAPVAENPADLLGPKGSYSARNQVAQLQGLTYAQNARLILKVSYNIGADTSLVLYGLTQGVDSMSEALAVERENLAGRYGIPESEYAFVDGSGGGKTTATTWAVTRMLQELYGKATFPSSLNALPILGVDGSLAFVTDFEADRSLAGAKGRVYAKTGTWVTSGKAGLLLKGQAFGGFIDTKHGRRLVYMVVVNNVKIRGLDDVLQAFQDEGTISALLWRGF